MQQHANGWSGSRGSGGAGLAWPCGNAHGRACRVPGHGDSDHMRMQCAVSVKRSLAAAARSLASCYDSHGLDGTCGAHAVATCKGMVRHFSVMKD